MNKRSFYILLYEAEIYYIEMHRNSKKFDFRLLVIELKIEGGIVN